MTYSDAIRATDLADVCDRLWAPDYFGLTPALRSKQPRDSAPANNRPETNNGK